MRIHCYCCHINGLWHHLVNPKSHIEAGINYSADNSHIKTLEYSSKIPLRRLNTVQDLFIHRHLRSDICERACNVCVSLSEVCVRVKIYNLMPTEKRNQTHSLYTAIQGFVCNHFKHLIWYHQFNELFLCVRLLLDPQGRSTAFYALIVKQLLNLTRLFCQHN